LRNEIEKNWAHVSTYNDNRRGWSCEHFCGQGEILVYSSTQKIEGKIDVGKQVDQLKLGPRGDTLILTSGRNKTVQVATVDFIKKINTAGAPFKGAEDAAVVIAVFDDFQ
jgi:hypothetical protein